MPRPAQLESTRRKSHVFARVKPAQKDIIEKRAERVGLTVSAYVRHMALHGRIETARTGGADFQLINELKRVGNNLNQLAYHANIHDEMLPEIGATLKDLQALFDKIAERL